MKQSCMLVLLLTLILGSGCEKPGAAVSSAPAAETNPNEPTQAQPKLPTVKLWLGAEELSAELAVNTKEVMTGMMFRTNMAETDSMLFVFGGPHQAQFWMKNTKVPLSAAYIDPDGTILEIHPLEPENTNTVKAASDRVQFVLETRQGWFQRHNVREGMVIRTERGSLLQLERQLQQEMWRRK